MATFQILYPHKISRTVVILSEAKDLSVNLRLASRVVRRRDAKGYAQR